MRGALSLLIALFLGAPAWASGEASSGVEPTDVDAERDPPPAEKPQLKVGGAIRFNALWNSWPGAEDNRRRGADLVFDTFRVNADGGYKGLGLSVEYRFYAGYNMLHHGWLGYAFSDLAELRVGVQRVPFGLLPYASHNWFFDLPYYVGLEDDYDLGLKLLLRPAPFDLQLAFYKNDEGSYTGASRDSARYSYDLVLTGEDELAAAGVAAPLEDEETNQLNVRLTRTFSHAEWWRTEVGVSGLWGGIYNRTTQRMGNRWAAAVHVDSTWGGLNLQLEAATYAFHPASPAGGDRAFVAMGAYDAPYKVARRGHLLVANLAYSWPVEWGPLESVTAYNDHSVLVKPEEGYADSQQNVTGVLLVGGPLFTYLDVAAGRNHPFLGPDYAVALAEGGEDASWQLRLNLNLGYYF